ncbi:hypothetical protein TGGT1_236140 [Toxoplasma gondii GT1]|uniref:Signal recognition particle domain protein n=2 Tax=Toxoplasma gondii TaxID=5811 RepID=S7W613_TOXGG|nr:hypothetical protein TGGT1_236140 [Toxoplasma gondii GT1]KAF4640220.1 hypothetical protein TGRH88_041450 [Toxoplasma gondii]
MLTRRRLLPVSGLSPRLCVPRTLPSSVFSSFQSSISPGPVATLWTDRTRGFPLSILSLRRLRASSQSSAFARQDTSWVSNVHCLAAKGRGRASLQVGYVHPSGAGGGLAVRGFGSGRRLSCIEELERRLETGGGAGGGAGGFNANFQGEVLTATADVFLVRGLGAASVGSLVRFESQPPPPSTGSDPQVARPSSASHAAAAFNVGVVLQLLDSDLTIVGFLGCCGDATPAQRLPVSSPPPLVGDVCTLVEGGDDRIEAPSEKKRPSSFSPSFNAPLSPLSLFSCLSSSTENPFKKTPRSSSFNVFSLPPRGDFSSPGGEAAALPTGSAVLDSLSPFRLGSATALVGPVGTGKSMALLPLVASHLVASSDSRSAPRWDTCARGSGASSGGVPPPERPPPPSVVFLALGTSPAALRQWLDTLRAVAIPSATAAAVSAATAAPAGWADEEERRRKSRAAADGGASEPEEAAGDEEATFACRNNADLAASVPPGVLVLHVPPDAGHTSCCMYTAPMVALKAALASEAAGQNVLLVIDGVDAHAAAAAQLKQTLGRLLASPSTRTVLPASGSPGASATRGWSVHTPGGGLLMASHQSGVVDGSDSGSRVPVLPFASLGSFYGQLASQAGTSDAEGRTASLSLVCTLDTPPGVSTPGNSAAAGVGADLTKQEKQWNRVVSSAIQGDASVGDTTLRKVLEAAQEALVSSVDRAVVFQTDVQLDRQSADQLNKDRVFQWRHKSCGDSRDHGDGEASWRRPLRSLSRKTVGGVGSVYPMLDLDFLLSSSPALLSADACAALSASCFSPAFQATPPPPELLFDALKDLCRRYGKALRHTEKSPGVQTAGRRAAPMPPPLLAAAASAFAWQQKVLGSQRERQEMMAALNLFVDIWEEEDLTSLRIASGVCTAQIAGRVFSATEQVLLLRAAATLLFSAPAEEERVAEQRPQAVSASYKMPWFVGQDRGLVSFRDICSFQESLLKLFRETHPTVWRRLEASLAQSDEKEVEMHAQLGENSQDKKLVVVEREGEELDKQVTELLHVIGEIDRALLALRHQLALTRPPAEE